MNMDLLESKLSQVHIHLKRRSCDRLIAVVGISGFEPEQTEPKSVVLPLHHIPIPGAKIPLFYLSAKDNVMVSVFSF